MQGRDDGYQSELTGDTGQDAIRLVAGGVGENREADVTAIEEGTVSVVCARCGDGWSATRDQPFFDDHDDAVTFALALGWDLTGKGLLCPDCALCEVCARAGHRWARWTTIGPSLSGQWPGGRVRYCRVCTTGQFDPPIGSGARPVAR
jgi:hypothetical protein